MKFLNILFGLLLLAGPVSADGTDSLGRASVRSAADAETRSGKRFTVQIHGTVRGKFEYQPEIGKSRFQVRNARFSLSGNVTPIVAYKAEIDLSDEGAIKMLDAYVRLNMLRQKLRFSIGQMRVPFTIDAHRSPHEQYFANRSFIAKQAGNVRDVGATLGWSFGRKVPVVLEGGVFNGSGLTDQKDFWTGTFNYSVKAQALFAERVNLTLSIQKTHPDIVKMYPCGPTVYHFAHIGNLRSYIMEDVLEKALRYEGYDVNRVMNITDVGHLSSDADTGEDKMVKGAKREHKTVMEIAQYYTDAFFADCKKLNIKRPDVVQDALTNILKSLQN